MIRLTRINHVPLVLNSDLIEHIAATPDTVISLTNGQKFMVLESADEIVDRVIEFRRAIFNSGFNSCAKSESAAAAREAML
jgi:flagellar protein FlbD